MLEVRLDRALPGSLPAGSATTIFFVGSCFHPEQRITELEVVVDGVAHRTDAHGLPRPDIAVANASAAARAYFSGFWATVPITVPDRSQPIEVALAAGLADGQRMEQPLGEITVSRRPALASVDAPPVAGTIAICMATFDPDEALFRAQVESLRSQTDEDWICLISDDCSAPERFERLVHVVAGDRRFTISRSEQRLGFYRNFERALELVPAGIELVALCDQDDRWHPDKLAVLRGAIGDAVLVYSDLRLVEADGRVRRATFWQDRRNNYNNLASMVIANTITGAAAMFRRELIDLAVPFPDTPGFQFHDHWLAVVALTAGPVAYVDRPLYDYVQHPGAVFGDVTHGPRDRAGPRNRRGLVRGISDRRSIPRWRAGYFFGYLSRRAQAQTALIRCESRLEAGKRRALERFIAADSSLVALAWLLCRAVRVLFGQTETLGTEIELAQGIVWKHLIAVRSRYWHHRRGPLSDASVPPPQAFVQKRLRRWRATI